MLTSEGLRCVWNSFLLDAYKQYHDVNDRSDRYGDSAIFGVGNETHTLNFGNFILSLIMIKSPGLFRMEENTLSCKSQNREALCVVKVRTITQNGFRELEKWLELSNWEEKPQTPV
ncbi:hypothetical protein RLOC_00011105 [Lonchura striata]|uniref:Uncharacterized protein n=1 Tax=Lonchura striata TaxID=40157 RepID=A0A218VE41_9PASE|nr:hypothetical protein RLOC_00011105 [Lonchura striata domestica]